MSFNQIKKSETLLKDKTNSAWIVGYIARNTAATTVTVSDSDFDYVTVSDIATAMGISEAALAALLNFDGVNSYVAKFTNSIEFRWGYYAHYLWNINPHRIRSIFSADLSTLKTSSNESVLSWAKGLWRNRGEVFSENLNDEIISQRSSILASMDTITGRTYLTDKQLEILRGYLNQIVYYNGEYYQLSLNITSSGEDPRIGYSVYTAWPAIANAVDAAAAATPANYGRLLDDGEMAIFTNSTNVYIQLQRVSDESGVIKGITASISSSRRTVNEQVFDMFAIPYGEVIVKNGLATVLTTRADAALSISAAIAGALDASCYDIQLLPYCPVVDMINDKGYINIANATEDKEYSFIDKTDARIRDSQLVNCSGVADAGSGTGYYARGSFILNKPASDILDSGYTKAYGADFDESTATVSVSVVDASRCEITFQAEVSSISTGDNVHVIVWYEVAGTQHYSIILWGNKNKFSTMLDYSLALTDSVKVDSQCNKYRLVSPNYQGSFEFSVAKNGGSVAYFIADCTYRPYTPYIKVAPAFEYLYGTNFGDCRGLICGGDFSLPRFTSAWETYELNNKNYQNIFNREIQNLDLEQDLTMRQQLISGALGIVTSGAVGAGAGLKATGSPYGAIAGAALGLTGSAVGMGIDIDILGKRQKEARDFSIDKFNYQLGNIKALPYTLTKVGAFDINSKIWPFLEFYTCTDEEKEALQNKIKYESMTVMRVGYVGEFYSPEETPHYLKCELIRNEEIAEDNHIFEAIYTELAKGVYI